MAKPPKTVLVVDDDQSHLTTTHEILRAEGYRVLTHKSAFGVVNLVQSHRPDLVLLDVNMPGLSGDGLAELLAVNPLCSATRVVFHSSNDEDDLRRLARTHQAQGYICKGSPQELRRRVAAFIG